MDHNDTTKPHKIISSNVFMTIATASLKGEPWSTPVYYAYDESFNFFWYSSKDIKHSQLIASNKKVAGNLLTKASVKFWLFDLENNNPLPYGV